MLIFAGFARYKHNFVSSVAGIYEVTLDTVAHV